MDVTSKRINLQNIFLIILFCVFPFSEVLRVQFSNSIAVIATDLSVFAFIFVSGIYILFRKRFINGRLIKPIIFFFAVALISLFVNISNLKNTEALISSLYLIRWIGYAAIYIAALNLDKRIKNKIPQMLIISGGVILAFGFIQYFFYPNLRNLYYLGWDEHLYRMFSSFLDPNFAGAFFVLYLLFTLGMYIKSKKLRYGLISIITLLGIVLTFSRSAYLMLFVGIFTFFILQGKNKSVFIFVGLFMVILAILSIVGLKSEGTNLFRITSTEARIPSAKNALVIFQKNPIIGVGFNAYEFASKKYGFLQESKFPNHAAAGTDNSFLFVLATTGVIGLISYLFIWFRIISMPRKNIYSTILISSGLALLVDGLFINSLFYSSIMLWMWFLAALAETNYYK